MKQTLIAITILFSIGTISCNNNARSAASMQQLIDNGNNTLQNLNDKLVAAKSELAVAQDKFNHAQEFQIGRSQGKRESDIREASNYFQKCQNNVNNIHSQIVQLQLNIAKWQTQLQNATQ